MHILKCHHRHSARVTERTANGKTLCSGRLSYLPLNRKSTTEKSPVLAPPPLAALATSPDTEQSRSLDQLTLNLTFGWDELTLNLTTHTYMRTLLLPNKNAKYDHHQSQPQQALK